MTVARPRGADPALLRQLNAVNTLRVLHPGGPMTLTKIVEATGLARRTAEAAVERLVAEGLAVEDSPDPPTRGVGRPARSFRFRAEAGYVLGIDIGVHEITAVLADLGGEVRARSTYPVARTAGRAQRVAAALDCAAQCRTRAGVAGDGVWATTVGTPGIVADAGYVSLCHVLPEWSEFSLADALAADSAGPVLVENDTNLAAMAERWCGAAQDVDSMVWVLTGRRVSAAILIDGRLYRGVHGAAGEIGWVPELGWSRLSEQTELDAFAAALAPGLTALVLVVDPRCLVIGGGITAASDRLLPAVAARMRPHCLRMPDLRVSALGPDAVALGAVRHSLDQVERTLFATASAPVPPI